MTRYLTLMLLSGTLAMSAPNDDVVSMASKVTLLMEWALETQLTPEERALIERTQAEAWTRFDAQQKQNLVSLARLQDSRAGMPAGKQAEFRQQLQKAFLETLRQTPDNAGSKRLLAAYARSHGQVPAGFAAPPQQGGTMPAELVGEWSSMHTSTVAYRNSATGAFAAPSGNGMLYHFFPDGRFQSAGLIQSSMYNCTMTVNAWEEGTVHLNGNVIVFDSKGGTLDSKDNCNARFNYKKPIQPNQTTYNWRLERDQYGVKFCIVKPGTKEDCAYKR